MEQKEKYSIPKYRKTIKQFLKKYFNGNNAKYRFTLFNGYGLYIDDKTQTVVYQAKCKLVGKTLEMPEVNQLLWTWGWALKKEENMFLIADKLKFENMFEKTANIKKDKCVELENLIKQNQFPLTDPNLTELFEAWQFFEYGFEYVQEARLHVDTNEDYVFGLTEFKKINQPEEEFYKSKDFHDELLKAALPI